MESSFPETSIYVICNEPNVKDMRKIETQIHIKASPAAVWAQLVDFERYPEWNPFLISVVGKAEVGGYLKNTIRNGERKEMKFEPEVLEVLTQKELRWKGKLFVQGLFDGEHYFRLSETTEGETLLTHGENFTGVLSSVLYAMIGKDTQVGFEAMNKA